MITISLCIIIIIISILCLINCDWYYRFQFNPLRARFEIYRFITYSFVHSNYIHLISNIFILLIFGLKVESYLNSNEYFFFIFFSIIISAIPGLKYNYSLVGASGLTSSLIFFCVLHYPIVFWFSLLYLFYCYYANKYSKDNIAHAAHLYGSMFAIIFCIIMRFDLFFNIFVP